MSLLMAAWAMFLLTMFVPVYDGEYATPGPIVTLSGFVLFLAVPGFAVAAATHSPSAISGAILAITIAGALLALFVLCPFAMDSRIAKRPKLMIAWACLLWLAAVFLLFYLALGDFNNVRATAYMLPISFVLAGGAVWCLGQRLVRTTTATS